MTTRTADTDLAPLLTDDREGARVALVGPRRDPLSETLTASVRRTTNGYAIVQPRTFTFTQLRPGIVDGLAVYVGDWRGMLPVPPRPLTPGDTYTLLLPEGLA
jgi:hypothetical protein